MMPEKKPDYDGLAVQAKSIFLNRLKTHMKATGLWQKDIAKAIGVTNASVSLAMRCPENCSENFIRLVSCHFSELGMEYFRFRASVDGPFIPGEQAQTAAQQVGLYDESLGLVDCAIEHLQTLRKTLT